MKKTRILKTAKGYIKFFEECKTYDKFQQIEYIDFVKLHLGVESNLTYQAIDLTNKNEYFKHAKSVKKYIDDNDSILNRNKSNFISRLNNPELITILIFVFTTIFLAGFYFGENKRNNSNNQNSLEKTEVKALNKSLNTICKN